METRIHLLVLALLVVYTVILEVIVARNVHALRSHHACADVSTPLCKTLATLLATEAARPGVFAALAAGRYHAVRIVVFDDDGGVLFDTHERPDSTARAAAPNETQRELRAAALGESAAQRLAHRAGGSQLVHTTGSKCADGSYVVVEAMAL